MLLTGFLAGGGLGCRRPPLACATYEAAAAFKPDPRLLHSGDPCAQLHSIRLNCYKEQSGLLGFPTYIHGTRFSHQTGCSAGVVPTGGYGTGERFKMSLLGSRPWDVNTPGLGLAMPPEGLREWGPP